MRQRHTFCPRIRQFIICIKKYFHKSSFVCSGAHAVKQILHVRPCLKLVQCNRCFATHILTIRRGTCLKFGIRCAVKNGFWNNSPKQKWKSLTYPWALLDPSEVHWNGFLTTFGDVSQYKCDFPSWYPPNSPQWPGQIDICVATYGCSGDSQNCKLSSSTQ